jgi:hypothetical protein
MELKPKQFQDMIETCAAKGVTRLRISHEAIEVEFGAQQESVTYSLQMPESMPQATPPPDSGAPQEQDYFERSDRDIEADDDLAELQISNPAEFEERLARGELVNVEAKDD